MVLNWWLLWRGGKLQVDKREERRQGERGEAAAWRERRGSGRGREREGDLSAAGRMTGRWRRHCVLGEEEEAKKKWTRDKGVRGREGRWR